MRQPPLTKDPQIVALIHAVCRNSSLYDFRVPNYNNNDYNESVWKLIADECKLECANEAKTIWQKLKQSFTIFYRNELIRLVSANYDEDIELPPEIKHDTTDERFGNSNWGYYADMRFIAPFRIKGADPELDRLIELAKPIVSTPKDKFDSQKRISQVGHTQNEVQVATTITQTATATIATEKPTAEELPAYFDIPTPTTLSSEELCLGSFFEAMFRGTRALPPHLQRRVKRELLKSLHSAEVEAEQHKNN